MRSLGLAMLLAFGFCIANLFPQFEGAYRIPDNHKLWGPMGPPSGLTKLVRRATSTSTSSSSSTSRATSASSASSASSTSSASSPSSAKTSGTSTQITSSSVRTSSTILSAVTTSTAPVDGSCKNGPFTRQCWVDGFSIATDFDTKWPNTGRTVTYNLEITNTTCNPDGNGARTCLLVNGVYPGPTLYANWGDTISVTFKNSLPYNGTSIHWHGIRQLGSNTQDGVNGITECPLAPGDSKTYKFQATQYGTTWYHSHYSNQYGDGLMGALIINGPATANYDIDLGAYPVSDWTYTPAFAFGEIVTQNLQKGQGPPPSDTILINGTNKNAAGGGQYGQVNLTPGKKHRLRLINTSVDNQIRVSLDGHSFQVITSDFVPVEPYLTNWILLAIGQRYDVIVTANQTAGSYFFRAEVAQDCASANNFYGRAVFNYIGTPSTTPNSVAAPLPSPLTCRDELPLRPWWKTVVPSNDFVNQVGSLNVDIGRTTVATNGQNIVYWGINVTAMDVDWRKPTLQYVIDGNNTYPRVSNLIELPVEGIWTYWIIQETAGTLVPIPHPMHPHGHDWFILGTGTGLFDKSSDPQKLTFNNPPRRDVTFLPGGGWVAVAFPTDNPGAWLMHCHISWHISEGLGVQFLEAKDQINLPDAAWQKTCNNWRSYYNGNPVYLKTDSGL